jgi:hypothetical protein
VAGTLLAKVGPIQHYFLITITIRISIACPIVETGHGTERAG